MVCGCGVLWHLGVFVVVGAAGINAEVRSAWGDDLCVGASACAESEDARGQSRGGCDNSM